MNKTISIIIPAYNAERFLGKSLDSILAQTYRELEVIVVNDASTDGTAAVIDYYASRDRRVRAVHKTANEGVSYARNDGLDLATGEYLLFVDSDDWIEPETCQRALDALQMHGADLVLWSYVREVGETSRPKRIFSGDQIFGETLVREKLYRRMVGCYGEELAQPENADALCTIWGKLYRRELIEQNHIRFPDIRKTGTYEDGLFNMEVMAHVKKAVFLDAYFYHYRRSQDHSLSTVYKADLPRKWKYMFHLIGSHIQQNEMGEDFSQALSNRIALSTISLGINETENRAGPRAVIRGLRSILRDEEYRSAIRKLDLSPMPIHWKAYFACAKLGCAWGLYGLLLVIQKIRGR